MTNRETMYEEINMSLTHFGDALLDDGFLPDHCTSHLIQIVTDKDAARRYADKSRKTLPVVNALYNIYANRATEHDLRVLREYMTRQIDAYVDACAEEVDEEHERDEMEAERRWECERDERAEA